MNIEENKEYKNFKIIFEILNAGIVLSFFGLFFKFFIFLFIEIILIFLLNKYLKNHQEEYKIYELKYLKNEKTKNKPNKIQKRQEKTFKTCRSCGCIYDGDGECPACYPQNNEVLHIKKEQPVKQSMQIKQNPKTQTKEELIDYLKKCSLNDEWRIRRAKYENFLLTNINRQNSSATVINSSRNKEYKTKLSSCTCEDFRHRQEPCKHIYKLADELSCFDLYQPLEKEVVNKLKVLWNNLNLVPLLIDVFYRVRDRKNKYYTKATPNIKKLKELDLIKIDDIEPAVLVDWKFNTNELRGMLFEKGIKKSSSKKELIELFIQDNKLLKKLPNNIKHIQLNFKDEQKSFVIDCLNYMNGYEN